MSDEFRKNLMGPEATLLPPETEVYQHLALGQEAMDLVAKNPTSSLLWAILAEEAWNEGRTIDSYAYARVGYHRGLDSLRRNGWRGVGPIPWEHEPNRGSCARCIRWGALRRRSARPRNRSALRNSSTTPIRQPRQPSKRKARQA
ncbi:hypothetical protein AHiyo6_26980 [Arthrobacter sp. Hiyo6]|nr:hypothetical protein AHiyo6_26980 [Arthrobacter sp. Hiyo6]